LVEELVVVAALPLACVHGKVRILDQAIYVSAITGIQTDADTWDGPQFVCEASIGLREASQDALGDYCCVLGVIYFRQYDDEFVSTLATQEIAFPNTPFQSPGNLLQQFVTGVMPERIIDGLEAVKIEKQNANQIAFALGQPHSHLKPITK
jgi:hypothetical protein